MHFGEYELSPSLISLSPYIRFAHDMPGWADYLAVTQADREALGMLWELYTLMREFPELARG